MKTILPLLLCLMLLTPARELRAQKPPSKGTYEVWLALNDEGSDVHRLPPYEFRFPQNSALIWEKILTDFRSSKLSFYLDENCSKKLNPHALGDFFQSNFKDYLIENSFLDNLTLPTNAPRSYGYKITEDPATRIEEDQNLQLLLDDLPFLIWLKESWDVSKASFQQQSICILLDPSFTPAIGFYLNLAEGDFPWDMLLHRNFEGIAEVSAQEVFDMRLFKANIIGMTDLAKNSPIFGPRHRTLAPDIRQEKADSVMASLNYPGIRAKRQKAHFKKKTMTKEVFSIYLEQSPERFSKKDSSHVTLAEFQTTTNFVKQNIGKLYDACLRGDIPAFKYEHPNALSQTPLTRKEMKQMKKGTYEEEGSEESKTRQNFDTPPEVYWEVTSKAQVVGKLMEIKGKKVFSPQYLILIATDPIKFFPDRTLWGVRLADLNGSNWDFEGKSLFKFLAELDYFFYPIDVNNNGLHTYEEAFWLRENLLEKTWKKIDWSEFYEKFSSH